MFGLSGIATYFLINLLYTLIIYIFLYNNLINMVIDAAKQCDDINLDIDTVKSSFDIFLIASIFIGTLILISDLFTFIFRPNLSVWLYERNRKRKE